MSAAPAYVPVPVETLAGEEKIDFDLYVQLNSRHVLYLRKGNAFDDARIEKMREKNVRNMWILQEDTGRFQECYKRRLDEAYTSNSRPLEQRTQFIQKALVSGTENLIKNMADPGVYMISKEEAKRFTEFVLKEERSLKTLVTAPNTERSIAQHGVSTAAIAISLARQLGIGGQKDLHLLTLGCLIHDAGHKSMDAGFGKKRSELTLEQQKIHRDHPLAGVRSIQEFVHFDQHVVKVVVEHEECANGSGFPKGLKEKDMHPYSVIAQTANAFDHMIAFEGETLQGALKQFFIDRIGRHPLPHFNALKAIVASIG